MTLVLIISFTVNVLLFSMLVKVVYDRNKFNKKVNKKLDEFIEEQQKCLINFKEPSQ